jgi:hypothetical protein
MSESLNKFRDMQNHQCGDRKVVIVDQLRYQIRIECLCGVKWIWLLFSELKLRRPEGYCEWLFQDVDARKRLDAFVNGVLVVNDEAIL